MSLLLVGFQPLGHISYPHLNQVAEHLVGNGADYSLFRERGYFLGSKLPSNKRLRAFAERILSEWHLAVDIGRLAVCRLRGRHHLVVAVDNAAYIVASLLFSHVVLWSHDFLTRDEPRSNSFVQRFISSRLRNALLRNRRLIIQDDDRWKLFASTYLRPGEADAVDTFFLPVSVRGPSAESGAPMGPRPVLMQIGGISAGRSRSDQLLADYQNNFENYELAFHGFFDKEMTSRIANAPKQPWNSALPLPPEMIGAIVAKCDIGFISYNADNDNFYFIARASGQLAEFLRCGKPVIVLGRSSLDLALPILGFGIAISSISQLADAISRIRSDYPEFCDNARRAFRETYDLERHLQPLNRWLESPREEAT